MENLKTLIQYSNSNLNNLNYNNSTVSVKDVLRNISDLIEDDGYHPYYASRFRKLGHKRFMELANKARAGSETPSILFRWMLENNEIVR